MASADNLTVTVTADTTKIRELRSEAEPLGELLQTRRDWAPYILGLAGWLFALVEWISR